MRDNLQCTYLDELGALRLLNMQNPTFLKV